MRAAASSSDCLLRAPTNKQKPTKAALSELSQGFIIAETEIDR